MHLPTVREFVQAMHDLLHVDVDGRVIHRDLLGLQRERLAHQSAEGAERLQPAPVVAAGHRSEAVLDERLAHVHEHVQPREPACEPQVALVVLDREHELADRPPFAAKRRADGGEDVWAADVREQAPARAHAQAHDVFGEQRFDRGTCRR